MENLISGRFLERFSKNYASRSRDGERETDWKCILFRRCCGMELFTSRHWVAGGPFIRGIVPLRPGSFLFAKNYAELISPSAFNLGNVINYDIRCPCIFPFLFFLYLFSIFSYNTFLIFHIFYYVRSTLHVQKNNGIKGQRELHESKRSKTNVAEPPE